MPLKNLLKPCPLAPKVLTFVVLTLLYLHSSGQQVTEFVFDGTGKNRREQIADFTAIAVRPSTIINNDKYPVLINGVKEEIPLDPDVEVTTFFKSLELPGRAFEINATFRGAVYLINSGSTPILNGRRSQASSNDCFAFESIPQSSWRQGLPAPNFDRIQHNVSHLVVHHTAGSNSNTNYTQVIRDIYLFHTEVNQWSDIGYNFLIAQDGTIFEGRDPGDDLTEFEVVGAHFCGKNTGTLGVAMLGNYELATPTEDALLSLQSVLATAADFFDIDVLQESPHRGSTLAHIAGHRDGCATLCPGENLYPLLAGISEQVFNMLICEEQDSLERPLSFGFFPNPISAAEYLNINAPDSTDQADVISLSGKVWSSIPIQEGQIYLGGIPPGIYLLRMNGFQSQKLIIKK